MGDNIWTRNGGVYLGFQCAPPLNYAQEDNLIAQKVDTSDMPSVDEPLRGTWKPLPQQRRYPAVLNDRENHPGDRSIFVCGPNGTGKTQRLLVPNLYYLTDWSCVVVDPKGELCALTARHRHDVDGHKVVVIDPFNVMAESYPELVKKYPYLKSHGYNPVMSLDPGTPEKPGRRFVDDAKKLAEAMIVVGDENDKHWATSAQTLVKGLLMVGRLEGGPSATLEFIRDLIGLDAEQLAKVLTVLVAKWKAKYPAVAASLNRFTKYSPENREIAGILSNAQTQTDWLDSLPIREDLQKGEFDFSTLKRLTKRPDGTGGATTVYLILPPDYLKSHGTWLRIIIASILTPLLRSTEDAEVPVLLALDEIGQLGKLQIIEDNLAIMRGYGVKLLSVWQDLSQVQDLYGKRWQSFLGNAGVKQIFAPQDTTTLDYFANLSGKRTFWKKTGGTTTGLSSGEKNASISTGSSTSWTNSMEDRLKQTDLAAMKAGYSVLFGRGNTPRAWCPFPGPDFPDSGLQTMLARAKSDMGKGSDTPKATATPPRPLSATGVKNWLGR